MHAVPIYFLIFSFVIRKNNLIIIIELTLKVKISLNLSTNVERRLHPIYRFLIIIRTFVNLTLLFIFIWWYSKRHSHFYCCHDQSFHFFGLGDVHKIDCLLLHFGLLCLRIVYLIFCACVCVMFESLSSSIERFFLGESQFRVHLLDLSLNSIVKIWIIHWRRTRLFSLFQVYHLHLFPQFTFWVVSGYFLLICSWARL